MEEKQKKKSGFGWKQAVTCIFLAGIIAVFLLTCGLKWRSIGKNVYHVFRDYDRQSSSVWTLLEEAIDTFEGNFNNFLWGGKTLSSLDTNLNYLIKGEINSVQVLLGKENWLFYKTVSDGEPLVDYQGSAYYSEQKMAQISQHLEKMEEELSDLGIDFVVMVCPNKEQVMERYMPDEVIKINSESRTDRLMKYLEEHTDLTLVYPLEEMRSLSGEYDLYYHYDTHWNALGGYLAVQQLASALGEERGYLEECRITAEPLEDHSSGDRDLARLIGMTWRFQDEWEYVLNGTEFSQWDETLFYQDQALADKKVMIIGDSFRIGLKPALTQMFSEVLIIHRDEYTPQMLEEFQPEVVVLEYVERYSGEMGEFSLR